VIGASSLVMALLLALAEIMARHVRTLKDVKLTDALAIGVAQVGALIPGVSRSGSTLTAALFLGLERAEAARFSFLLGLPAIALAGGKELWELYKVHLDAHAWSVLAVGLITGSVAAFVAIWGLLHILEKFSAWPFVVYRGLIGLLLLVGAVQPDASQATRGSLERTSPPQLCGGGFQDSRPATDGYFSRPGTLLCCFNHGSGGAKEQPLT
jgi:undecaprenyl-diphosphatase